MANLKSALEVFSKSIVQPLMYLSVAGTVLILGILLTNQTIVAAVPVSYTHLTLPTNSRV